MKYYFFFIFVFIAHLPTFGQKENSLWVLPRNLKIDVSSDTFQFTDFPNKLPAYLEGNITVSDSLGNLLFYSDGMRVYDRNNDTMPGSLSIPISFKSSSSQQCVAVKTSSITYSLFSVGDTGSDGELYFSQIDMNKRNNLGDVLDNIVFLGKDYGEALLATPHKCHGYWILVCRKNSDEIHAFHFINSLLIEKVVSSVGQFKNSPQNSFVNNLNINSLNELVYSDNEGAFEKYNFDNNSGKVNNSVIISYQGSLSTKVQGAFSPNQKLFYIYGDDKITQYETHFELASQIKSSATIIYTHNSNLGFSGLRKLRDKIYFISPLLVNTIGVIKNPDTKGVSCDFNATAIGLPFPTRLTKAFPTPLIFEKELIKDFLPKDTALCSYTTFNISTAVTMDSITWSTGEKLPNISLSQPGIYTATAYKDGCSYVDTFHLNSANLTAEKSIFSCRPTLIYKSRTLEVGKTYLDTVSGAGCDTIYTLSILSDPKAPSKNINIAVCKGQLHKAANGLSYGPAQSYQEYKKSIIADQCDTLITYNIVQDLDRSDFLGKDIRTCKQADIMVKILMLPNEKILWENNSTESLRTFTTNDKIRKDATAQLTTATGCIINDTINIWHDYYSRTINHWLCPGEKILIDNKWFEGNNPPYIDTIIGNCDTVFAHLFPPYPAVNVIAQDLSMQEEPLAIDVAYTGSPINYRWSPSTDLSCADCPHPTILKYSSSRYKIEVENKYGCKSSDSLNVTYLMPEIICPTVINPLSKNEENTVFFLKGNGIKYDMTIYDRWGNMAFKGKNMAFNDVNSGWRPTELILSGVYIYAIIIYTDNGNIIKRGDVTIIR
jgi:hypothetical protein